MKTKHIFVIFLFFFTTSILAQNKYERMNGIFEGRSDPGSESMYPVSYYFKFEVWQDVIGIKGELSKPNFKVYTGMLNEEPFILMEQTRANEGADFSVGEVMVLTGDERKGGPVSRIECRFIQATDGNGDQFLVEKFEFPGVWEFQPVTLKRVK